MTLNTDIETALSRIELQCEALFVAVNGGEPIAIESASQTVRQGAVDFSTLLQGLDAHDAAMPALRQRLGKVAAALAIQRTGLIRRTAAVERTLHAMMPATRETTYAKSAGFRGAGRPSGAFKTSAA